MSTPRLLVPRDHIRTHPATPGEFLAYMASRARRRGRELVEDPRTVSAYVDRGRWVADCPHCNGGIAIHPEWQVAPCGTCLRVYRRVTVPARWQDIEAVLMARPMLHQNWHSADVRTRRAALSGRDGRVALPDETLAELVAENLERGVPVDDQQKAWVIRGVD